MTDTVSHPELDGLGTYEYGWSDPDAAGSVAKRGLSEEVVRDISAKKSESEWSLAAPVQNRSGLQHDRPVLTRGVR